MPASPPPEGRPVIASAPPPDQLRRYLLGTLPPDDHCPVESWVASDPTAVNQLDTLIADDAVLRALSTPCPVSWDDPLVESVVQALQKACDADRGVAPAAPLRPGQRLGDYRVVREIGRGGMGVVYEAVDEKLGRPAAVKVLDRNLLTTADHRARFFREARTAAALRSDHTVTVYQYGEVDGHPYIAMELLKGIPLDQHLKQRGRLPNADIARLFRELLTGLADTHREGLIHRDIKPSNLWVTAGSGRLKVYDFGLGRAVGDPTGPTLPGLVVGTPEYMSPEQAEGKPVDFRGDLFSAGVVLYRLFADQSPFRRDGMLATLAAVTKVAPEQPAGMPAAVWAFLRGLLSKSPDDRPADATVALREWAAVEPELLAEPERPARRSRGRIAAGFGAVAAVLALGVVIVIWREGKVQVVVAPENPKGTVTVVSKTDGVSIVVEPPPPPPPPPPSAVGKRVTVVGSADLFAGYDDKWGNRRSHQIKRGSTGVVKEVSDASNKWRVVWDDEKDDPHGCWMSAECLEPAK